MLLSNKLYKNSDLLLSRGYFLGSIAVLFIALIIVSLLFKGLKLEIVGFNDNGISQSKYHLEDTDHSVTDLMDFFKTKSFVLILMSLFIYISAKVSFLMYGGKDNIKDLENIEIVCRQTDYDDETALRELNNNDNNVEKVIKKYLEMGVKKVDNPVKNKSVNEMIHSEIREYFK